MEKENDEKKCPWGSVNMDAKVLLGITLRSASKEERVSLLLLWPLTKCAIEL